MTEAIHLHNLDCLPEMRKMPDKAFELAIVDPPYGINASKGVWGSSNLGTVTNYGRKVWDKKPPQKGYFTDLLRVSENQIICGGNYFIDHLHSTPCMVVWDKLNSGDFADCELLWTSFNTAVRKFTFLWNGMLQGDMKNKEIRIHPTQKPVALYEWLLKNYAKPGDHILDTHFGSLSIGIACYNLGFDLTAYEIDKDYFNAGKARLENHMKKGRLFETVNGRVVPTQKKIFDGIF